MASKNLKVMYKDKVKKSDVKINIEEQPFIKEDIQSKYVRLSVETPVNSEIQLVAQIATPEAEQTGGSFMSIYSIIIAILLSIAAILSASIYRAIKSVNSKTNSYTTFPAEFLNSPREYARGIPEKTTTFDRHLVTDIDSKMISPISTNDFSCFNLPSRKEEEILYLK